MYEHRMTTGVDALRYRTPYACPSTVYDEERASAIFVGSIFRASGDVPDGEAGLVAFPENDEQMAKLKDRPTMRPAKFSLLQIRKK